MKEKILILSLSAGAGHVKCAQGLFKTLKKNSYQVQHFDTFVFLPKLLKKIIADNYNLLTRNSPQIWRLLYQKTNRENILLNGHFVNKIKKQIAKQLYDFIQIYQPDKIICTHFLPADLIKQNPKIKIPVYIIITDYDIHQMWLIKNINKFFVATETMRQKMIKKNIQANKIIVSGIPFDEDILIKQTKTEIKKEKEILILAGGYGLISITDIIKYLNNLDLNFKITAISGKNNNLFKKLLKLKINKKITVKQWVNNIGYYLQKADLIITKPGGLTITEAINLQKPLLLIKPLPGQEEANANFIVENNYGRLALNEKQLLNLTELLLQKKIRLNKFQPKLKANQIIINNL